MTIRRDNEQMNDEFYMRLQDVLDGRNVHDKPSVATGDMNTKDGDQN